ncbi:MAG: hypothetical protein MJE77_15440 [Proteobacteria bacterium]|nr:hypothetical protein [Pseudomonadota bacterium]
MSRLRAICFALAVCACTSSNSAKSPEEVCDLAIMGGQIITQDGMVFIEDGFVAITENTIQAVAAQSELETVCTPVGRDDDSGLVASSWPASPHFVATSLSLTITIPIEPNFRDKRHDEDTDRSLFMQLWLGPVPIGP